MSLQKWRGGNRSRGLTVVELLIAMAVFSLVMGLVFYVCVQALRLNAEIQERADLNDTAENVLTRMTSEMITMRSLLQAEEARVSFLTPGENRITYEGADGRLTRNGKTMLPPAITLAELRFEYYGNDFSLDANGDSVITFEEMDLDANGSLEAEELLKVSLIQVGLSLARANKFRATLQSSVKLRNPQSSPPAQEE